MTLWLLDKSAHVRLVAGAPGVEISGFWPDHGWFAPGESLEARPDSIARKYFRQRQ
ncbi:hypothetical protein [[Mycobacterium] zoologicum]|uniref:hypothetical protein n=1 Tax=[Mycobacterium] zoologicum TaxID=2872311 RepID=UPI002CD38D5C|nr:hypothetical protein [Mycolicibacter sp. MYC101]MEB3065309.1 hypothetical protein [Mycolicibacter sp. MYC101]